MPAFSDAAVIGESWTKPELFGQIFDRHFRTIHAYLARRLSTTDADDLAGEVFRIAFEKRRGFDPSRKSALPWLYGMASNLVLQHRRREQRAIRAMARERSLRQPQLSTSNSESLSDSRIDAERSHDVVVEALANLAADERELMLLAAFTDLSYRDLSEAMGLAEGTVRSKLSRTKAKLREQLRTIGQEQVEPPTQQLARGSK